MTSVAYLPIVADRYGPLVRHLYVAGLDLTGVPMRAQVRFSGDSPGTPYVDLLTVTNGNAQGLRLVEVTTDAQGLPTSHVEIVINETTMESLPYAGALGDAVQFAWDMQITIGGRKRRLAKGEFEITGDGVTGADAAPVNRPISYGRPVQPITSPWKAARLTFGEEQVTVQIVDADLVAPLVKVATDASADAADSRDRAALSAGAAQGTARYFTTRTAGEAASAVDQSFATDDGAGNVIYYRRTAGGSVEIGRAVTPASLAAANGASRVGYRARTIASRLSDEVWVGDFAPGLDASSDWTGAIRAAIASVDTSGGRGGTVHLPYGAIRTTDTIDVPDRIKLVGAGCRATIINCEHTGTAIRLEDVDFGGVSHMRITTATDSPDAVALEIYSNTLWTQWNNFEDLEISAGHPYTRGQKGIWCHSRDITTTITYNDWRNIRIGGYHRPWVIEDYYEGNFHYHIHVNGFGIDPDDPAILHWGAANHWECWFGKGGSAAPTLVGIAYAGQRTNNRFKVTADIGPGKAMKLIAGTMPKGGKANSFEVTGTEDVTPVGDITPYAPFDRGTFQPGIAGSESAGVATYNDRYGTFTRVGDRCFFEVTVGWSSHTGSGNIHLTGLPIPAADGEPQGMATVLASGLTFARQAVFLIPPGATAGILFSQGAGFESVALSSPALLRVSGSYRVVI